MSLAPSPPSLVKLALSLLTYVEPAPTPLPFVEPAASLPSLVVPAAPPPSLVVPAAPPPSLVVPAAPPPSLVVPAAPPPSLVEPAAPPPCSPAGRAPAPPAPARAPPSRRAPSPRGGPRRTILYSDEVGSGLGALLAERLSQGVLNNCHPGTSADRLIECISTGEFDRASTLIVFLGNSIDCTKRDILKLSATLSAIDQREVAKIIICALPYRMSSKVNKRAPIGGL
ncbi:uncharacterized protein LOC133528492 [Cydia pomonella]|uniref:uncharacterized protein LOC133528492 n=1 Tax=Cydia pomonella TaxID=82600 RepID=UPI002ADE703B|nr:uncharacterized protein LOC133528492 [Cydia pomonella]